MYEIREEGVNRWYLSSRYDDHTITWAAWFPRIGEYKWDLWELNTEAHTHWIHLSMWQARCGWGVNQGETSWKTIHKKTDHEFLRSIRSSPWGSIFFPSWSTFHFSIQIYISFRFSILSYPVYIHGAMNFRIDPNMKRRVSPMSTLTPHFFSDAFILISSPPANIHAIPSPTIPSTPRSMTI